MLNWQRLLAMLKKEFIQMRRDNMTLGMMLVMPVIQLLIFGFAINTDVKHLKTAVFDQSRSLESRELLNGLTACEYFDLKYYVQSAEEIRRMVDAGDVKVGIIIPPDLEKNMKHETPTPIQVIVDATDSTSASSAIAAAQSVGQLKSQEIIMEKYGRHKLTQNLYDIRIRSWYNPDFVTAFYMVPGITGSVLTMTMIMMTSMAIVREREMGTMEQLIVTPLSKWELLIGKIVPYVVVGYVQTTVALLVSVLVFDMPVRGNLTLLYFLSSLFIVASLTLGVMISTMAKNQMQAMQGSFFVLLPSVLLSGFMFPRESMSDFFYLLGNFMPLTYYLQILRGILLKGNSITLLWAQIVGLLAFIAATFGISVKKFAKRLD